MAVTNVAELNALVERVKKAQREYASFTQEQVDKIFRAAALAAADARIPLAKMAVAESGMGIVEDKVIKNHFASEYIYNAYKDEKTCGVLSEDDTFGTITIAEPIGIICGIVPTTNPTSTAIFKSLISIAIVEQEAVSHDERTFVAISNHFIQRDWQGATAEVDRFRKFVPQHVFSSLSNGFLVDQIGRASCRERV